MSKNVQRIITLLLILLMVCGMFPAALATEVDPTDASTEPNTLTGEEIPEAEATEPTEPGTEPTELPPEESKSTDPTEAPTEEVTEITEPTVEETTEPATSDPTEETHPVSDMEEEVTASRITIGNGDLPMLYASRAAITGTHYHRAIIWINGAESELKFTYNGINFSENRLYVHGVITGGKRYTVYCVDPGINTKEGTGGYSTSDTAWSDLDIDTQTAVGLALLYGAPNNLYSTDPKTMLTYEFATQIIITETILGFRSNLPPFECTDSRIIQKFGTDADGTHNGYGRYISSDSVDYASVHGENMNRTLLREAYDTIAANMASHYVLPSFASRYNAAAKTYEMTRQNDGTYAVTLTDTNNILSKCTFLNGNGLTYAVNGNKLTIRSETAFDTAKSCALTSSGGASKNVPNLEKQTFLLWSSGSYQRLVNLQEASSDPVPMYFNVIAKETKGTAKIIKKATNGGSISGWTFTVKNASGTVIGTYTTDSTGVISIDLEPGTYSVTEKATTDSYWVNDTTSTRKVTVKAGKTASVTFTNQWRGKAQIVKSTTNGGTVAGWHFTVKNSSGTKIGDYVTDSTGVITLDLDPGTYTVTETDGAQKYWVNDATSSKTVTVKAGQTAKVTFTNQYRGQAQIIKKATNGGSVSGWSFTVKNSAGTTVGTYTTDATGIITLDLDPGTYSVTEKATTDKYWVNDTTATKTVTVKAGQTASVTFTNQWKGKAQIIKTATNGGAVSGWHFTVKTSGGTKIGDYVTDNTGIITLDLEPGTYTVTETDGAQKYWVNDSTPNKTVTVKAGETAKVTFTNQYRGQAKIIKTTTNGGTLKGWEFTIKNASGSKVGTYTTDDTGTIVVDLEPGTYTVTETDRNDPYWYCDTEAKTVTVKAGETASVTFENRWIGKAKIIKTLSSPEAGTLEGWNFTITDSTGKKIGDYKTDNTGTIVTDLEPGTYTVSEVLEEGSLWQCTTPNSQTIIVAAGKTAEVTFNNALRPGKISIEKVDFQGNPLKDVEFKLEWSQDGKVWETVVFTDDTVPKLGGCTTIGLKDGILSTDKNGAAEFSGLYPTLQYRLTEVKTQDGYQLLKEPIIVKDLSQQEDLHIGLRVVNFQTFALPETGSKDFMWIIPGISISCLLGIHILTLLRRKEEKTT